ncbi:sensor histidine kinase [Bradyrhizobium quebecense]|uniref:HAMP domain-containing histidine kinase n=2 Tax=Bradyrhizobium quebecense TaxID=2748629 RepID=A0ACD3V758_9BRAD|nr:HAMP domain-containing sensor histidine kinase [Bradyrhizobium quebecense]UGY02259.1 HAMP domain-containing histidine kinase [Bradyrhizobium quebecense]
MRWASLRLRLVAGGMIAILVALGVAGAGLVLLFQRHVSRTMAADLDVHLRQLLAGIDIGSDGRLVITRQPADPRFEEPLSGLYWQVTDDRDQMLRSRSLWDTTLRLPPDEPGPSEVHQHEVNGPGDARVLVAERSVLMTAGDRRMRVRATVASDLSRAAVAVKAFAKDLSVALGLLALVLAIATSIQVGLGLRPLALLRRGISDIRAGRLRHLPTAVPSEVEPLVEEVNALLDAQGREIMRSRGRAADLAHGFKTPLAALIADAARLRERGDSKMAQDIEAVADSMSRYVDRELALARLRSGARNTEAAVTELYPLLSSLLTTLARTPYGEGVRFERSVPEGLRIPLDRTDLAEVLGNLLENAARHAKARVSITAIAEPLSVVVEDDGEGIPKEQIVRVLERGGRLDEQGSGTGLGLAIVQDVLEAYGWRVQITRSELGGARVTIARGTDRDIRAGHKSAAA